MLKKRIIPKLLLKFKKKKDIHVPILVNSFNYTHYKTVGDPISQAKIYEAQLADELALINIDSLPIRDNKFILELVKQFSFNIFMPLIFGGGVFSLECFKLLLSSGISLMTLNLHSNVQMESYSRGVRQRIYIYMYMSRDDRTNSVVLMCYLDA